MRILTVRQPWAWAIVNGGKTVENRIRNLAGGYRGPVAIHAGKAFDDAGWDHPLLGPMLDDALRQEDEIEFTPAAIVGVVDIVDVHLCSGECSPWALGPVDLGHGIRDLWHLVLENPRPLTEPIPYTGALGLRRLDDETIARIQAAIA